jgi:uncharacterized protein (DUF362 family)
MMRTTEKSRVSLAHTDNRSLGVPQALRALGGNPAKNRDVLIKPNFNTADPAPGSTHNDTLVALVDELWQMGARSVSVGERSYPRTASVMKTKGIVPLLEARDVRIIDFDELPDKDWVKVDAAGSHWKDGFRVARPILEADCLVSTGCLKTHQFGGVFTMSLKLHVGVVPTTRNGYDYMAELHGSPYQQELIAEINAPFAPQLVVLDGIDAFVDEGPATGKRVRGNVVLASTDRVAIDAVGVAVLKVLESNARIMTCPIFAQKQIARAVELGLGAASPEAIELVATEPAGQDFRDRVAAILSQG